MGWLLALLSVLGVIVCLVLCVVWQMFWYDKKPRIALPLERPNGIPVLLQNGLPYPGSFSRTSNPVLHLDGTWRFAPGSVLENPALPLKEVQIPFSFNNFGSELASYQGLFSFVKTFHLDAVEEGLYRLCLKSVGGRCSVYLNGRKLCDSTDSYQPVFCDATEALRPGENTLIVAGDNTLTKETLPPSLFAGSKPGWHVYAGINKSVLLERLPEQYCVRLQIAAGEERLRGEAVFAGCPKTCRFRLLDGERVLAEREYVLVPSGQYSTAVFSLERPAELENWTPENPKLYLLEAQTGTETVVITTGFRSVRTSAEAILLNEAPFTVKGVCMHEEDIRLGSALDAAAVERNLSLAQELGCNFIRLAHYPHGEEALDSCDRKGICSWSEIPNYQAGLGFIQRLFGKSKLLKQRVTAARIVKSILETKQLTNRRYLTEAGVQLAKMVIRNLNHPSVLFWGVGNECYSYTPASHRALRFLKNTVQAFDRTRLVGYAAFTIPGVTQRFERSFSEFDVVCANEYCGWYYGRAEDSEAFWQSLRQKYHKPMLCTETGSDARFGAEGVDLPKKNVNSEDYQVRVLTQHLQLLDKVQGYCGTCIWTLKDFYCDEYGSDDIVPFCNAKGLVSSDYQKKKAFSAVRDIFRNTPEK
ncbi:MAG TPA: glycoside hydrolase family 2 TIM barrel-domain containing protein [Candidatus Cryosericum sp.]|nr:glycoside hydrolase family 2 TIM barrel-domain containing protein [Candidatus Cryosericum sp.]